MKNVKRIFLLGLLLSLFPTAGFADEDTKGWEPAKEEDGIKVELRAVEGYAIKEFRGTTTMTTTVDALVALYLNPEQCVAWIPNCVTSRIVERSSPTEFSLYRELHSPWPIKNRDYVLRVRQHKNDATGEVTLAFENLKDAGEKSGCCIRMSQFKGFWKFTPAAGNSVIVTYQNHFNPGGGFPAALVNAGVANMPFDTLTNMRDVVTP